MDNTSNRAKRIAKNTMFLYFRMAFLIIIQLYTSRVVLDILGVEDYGIYNLVAGIIVVMSFLNNSMALSVNRYIAYAIGVDDKEQTKRVFSMSVNIHLIIAAFVFLFGETFGLWFVNAKLVIPESRIYAANIVYQASVVSFIFQILRVPYHADIIANENMNIFAYLSLFEGIAKLLIVFLLPIIPLDRLSVYAILMMGISMATLLFYVIYSLKNYAESHYCRFWSKTLFKEMMIYAGYSTFGNFSTGLVTQGQSVLLNIFFGPALNAARGLAVSVNGAVSGFVLNMFTAVNPQITKSYAQNEKRYFYSLIYNSTLLSFFLLYIIALPLILECEFVLSIWLKEVPDYTVLFVQLILVNSLVYYFYHPSLMAIQATGRVAKIHLITGCINLLNIAITYIIWKIYPYNPAVVFLVQITISFAMLIATIMIQKQIIDVPPKEYIVKTILPALYSSLCAMIPPIIVHYSIDNLLARFFCTCITSIISCLVVFYFIGLSSSLRETVKQCAKKFLKNNIHGN